MSGFKIILILFLSPWVEKSLSHWDPGAHNERTGYFIYNGWVTRSNVGKWYKHSRGDVPLGAFVLGRDHDKRVLYMASVLLKDGWKPARLVDGESCARTSTDDCYEDYSIGVGHHWRWVETDSKRPTKPYHSYCRIFFTRGDTGENYDAIGQVSKDQECVLGHGQTIWSTILNNETHTYFKSYQLLLDVE